MTNNSGLSLGSSGMSGGSSPSGGGSGLPSTPSPTVAQWEYEQSHPPEIMEFNDYLKDFFLMKRQG